MLRETFYYLLGGVTFLPLCIVAVVLHIWFYAPSVHDTSKGSVASDVELTHETKLAALDLAAKNAAIHDELAKGQGKDQPQGMATVPATAKRLGPKPASSTTSLKPFSSGWLTVRSKFESEKDAVAGVSAVSSLSAQNGDDNAKSTESTELDAQNAEPAEEPSTLNKTANNSSGYMSQMYRGILDYRIGKPGAKKPSSEQPSRSASPAAASSSVPTGTAGRENFYCILKAPILYLYSSDDVSNPNTECHAAIDLRGKRVSIFVAGIGDTLGELDGPSQRAVETDTRGEDTDPTPAQQGWQKAKRAVVRDGELFMKRNAIRIVGSASGRSRSPAPSDEQIDRKGQPRRRPQWFLFCKNTYFMEDWYHALIQSSLMPDASSGVKGDEKGASQLPPAFSSTNDPIGPIFSREDMASLLVSLDNMTDPLPLRWLNALVGRIFFSIYRTAWLEDYITSKMMKKLGRVKTPGFLGDIKVEEVDVGRRAPAFSRPMLKALTDEGEASMEIALHYVGEIRITISTTLSFSLGSRFKPYNIPIVLAVVVRSLEGNLLLHVKPPPSNRLWFGFTAMPKLELDIEPVVSERKVQWGMVTRLIESRLRELLIESIVVPNMDDMPFFDTRSFFFRGGVFADAVKDPEPVSVAAAAVAASASKAATEQATAPAQTVTSSLKPPEADVLQHSTASSAPVSGLSSPVSHAAEDADSIEAVLSAGDLDAANPVSNVESALRNRKVAAVAQPASSLSTRMSSPAVAGLSDLLSRDAAAGGGSSFHPSATEVPPMQDQKSGTRRKTWFGASPRSSTSSTTSSGLSALGLAAGSLGGRNHREQSSLALGNASIERPEQRSSSATFADRPKDLSVERPGITRPRSSTLLTADGVDQTKGKSTASSIERTSSRLSASTIDQGEAALSGSHTHATLNDDETQHGDEAMRHSSAAPTLLISEVSQTDVGRIPSDNPSLPPLLDINRATQASVLTDAAKELVHSPASLTHSAKSPATSLRHEERGDAGMFEPMTSAATTNGQNALDQKKPASSTVSMLSDRSIDLTDDSKQSSPHSIQHGFLPQPPPPPPRRPAAKISPLNEKSRHPQEATAALNNVQRSRYGLGDDSRDASDDSLATGSLLTSAALWNKAKASMADKESRQAAAKEAKDAIKRGWSSWNAKRAEAKRGQQNESEYTNISAHDSMTRSHASRMSLVPGQSAWLASSPPDPTSFGLGFDKASPEEKRVEHALPALPPHARHTVGDTDDDGGSAHSSSSSRQPYRDYRALKRTVVPDEHGQNISHRMAVTDASITASRESEYPTTSQWSAQTPSVPVPSATASHMTENRDSLERQPLAVDSTPPRPTPPRRKISTSISSNGSSNGVSFIPAAPSATTSLASTDGFSPAPQESSDRPEPLVSEQAQSAADTQLTSNESALAPTSSRTSSGSLRAQSADLSPQTHGKELVDEHGSSSNAVAVETPAPAQSSGIKKQPGRAAMMAVPGIPSMQKAGPQSFSAPAPPLAANTSTSPSMRRTSLFKLPSFGSPSSIPASLPAENSAPAPAETRTTTHNEPAPTLSQAREVGKDADYASVAKADGPSADANFEEALMDRGPTLELGDTAVKLADGSRTDDQIRPSVPVDANTVP